MNDSSHSDSRPAGRFLTGPAAGGAWQMAADEWLLASAPPGPVLRWYRWTPAGLSLGFGQRAADAAPLIARRPGVDVVRRITGGGAILHAGDCTYALVLPLAWPGLPPAREASFYFLVQPWLPVLAALGVEARFRAAVGSQQRAGRVSDGSPPLCFARETTFDLVVGPRPGCAGGARKLLGSAQHRGATHLLQHGSLVWDPQPELPAAVGLPALLAAGAALTPEELGARLRRAYAAHLGAELPAQPLDRAEQQAVARLAAEKYERASWTARR